MIQGHYWDCTAPKSLTANQVRKRISRKVNEGQASRFILNLAETPVTKEVLRQYLERKPVKGLREIKLVEGDRGIDYYP